MKITEFFQHGFAVPVAKKKRESLGFKVSVSDLGCAFNERKMEGGVKVSFFNKGNCPVLGESCVFMG